MLRKAFRMSVHAGQHEEYERRHRPIWPELEQVLLEHGVHTYSIFLDAVRQQHLLELRPDRLVAPLVLLVLAGVDGHPERLAQHRGLRGFGQKGLGRPRGRPRHDPRPEPGG